MNSIFLDVVDKDSIERFRWLAENGARFSWMHGKLKISARTWPTSNQVDLRELYLKSMKNLREIELLLSGAVCCSCGSSLDYIERECEPLCLDCSVMGVTARPDFFNTAIDPTSKEF